MTHLDRIRMMDAGELAEFLIQGPMIEIGACRLCMYSNPTPLDGRGRCLHKGPCRSKAKVAALEKWLCEEEDEQ